MSGFITALIKQRKDAKKAEPDTNGRLKEILTILEKYNYDDGITPEIVVNILMDLGPTFVKIGQIGVHANLGMDDRTAAVVSRLTGYAVRALLIAAFFIGSCLLCTVPVMADNGMTVTAVLAGLGVVGYIISVIFAYRLLKDVKKGK